MRSPFVLSAGYCLVWLGFAGVATLAQYAFTRAALLDTGMPVSYTHLTLPTNREV